MYQRSLMCEMYISVNFVHLSRAANSVSRFLLCMNAHILPTLFTFSERIRHKRQALIRSSVLL